VLGKLLAYGLEFAAKRVETTLTPHSGADILPRMGTDDGPTLVDSSDLPAFGDLRPGQASTDVALYQSQLIDKIAPIAPQVAEGVAKRVAGRNVFALLSEPNRALEKDFPCRLLAAARARKVQLKPDTIKRLQDQYECRPPQPDQ
jgi:hypothetical protein